MFAQCATWYSHMHITEYIMVLRTTRHSLVPNEKRVNSMAGLCSRVVEEGGLLCWLNVRYKWLITRRWLSIMMVIHHNKTPCPQNWTVYTYSSVVRCHQYFSVLWKSTKREESHNGGDGIYSKAPVALDLQTNWQLTIRGSIGLLPITIVCGISWLICQAPDSGPRWQYFVDSCPTHRHT